MKVLFFLICNLLQQTLFFIWKHQNQFKTIFCFSTRKQYIFLNTSTLYNGYRKDRERAKDNRKISEEQISNKYIKGEKRYYRLY